MNELDSERIPDCLYCNVE